MTHHHTLVYAAVFDRHITAPNRHIAIALLALLLFAAPAISMGNDNVERMLAAMTTEQKAGQLFFVALRETEAVLGADDESISDRTHYTLTDEDKVLFDEMSPGGVVLFGENIASDEQVRRLIADIKISVSIPPFVSVDQEGGRVQRIKHSDMLSAATFPPMLTVGSGKPRDAQRVGRTMGSDLAALGFNMDFAPVCDVFSNPQNTVIGDRAFSRTPRKASAMAMAFSRGLLSHGIIPCPKHFPGHGDTQSDSHYGTVILDKSLRQLNQTELIPFRRQIKGGAEIIMAAHITLPQFDSEPATLSPAIITGLLRGRLGFKGVVITDALGMKAITEKHSNEEAAILAIQAGCDMLLMCQDSRAAYRAVLSAVQSGVISRSRLDESVRRILRLKARTKAAPKR